MEIFKNIKNYEHLYQISNYGNIIAKSRPINGAVVAMSKERQLSAWDNGNGYRVVTLMMNKKRKNHYVHRLVATYFIENPLKYKEINHKDGKKENNHIDNLEWISRSGNVKHCYDTGLRVPTEKQLNALKKGRKKLCKKHQ